MPTYTVDTANTGLIAQVQRLAHIPLANVTFEPTDICALADSETRTHILDQILSVRESYYLTYIDTPVNATGVYSIPYRGIAGRAHMFQMVVGTLVYPFARIEPKDMTNTINPPTNTYGFYFEGPNIVTLPILPSGVMRCWHYVRPSDLVVSTSCAQVSVISGNNVTVTALPSGYSTGVLIDFVQALPPFQLYEYDVPISNVASNTLTFPTGDVPTNLVVGDWISLAGTTPIPQMPLEFFPLLAQRVSVKVLESQGYTQKMQEAQKKLEDMEKAVLRIINPRSEGNAKKITPNRGLIRPGPNRAQGYWYVAP